MLPIDESVRAQKVKGHFKGRFSYLRIHKEQSSVSSGSWKNLSRWTCKLAGLRPLPASLGCDAETSGSENHRFRCENRPMDQQEVEAAEKQQCKQVALI